MFSSQARAVICSCLGFAILSELFELAGLGLQYWVEPLMTYRKRGSWPAC